MRTELERLHAAARWFGIVRALAVPLAIAEVSATTFPPGYETWAWFDCGVLGLGAVVLLLLSFRRDELVVRKRLAEAAIVFDTAVVFGFIFVFSFKTGQPLLGLYYLPVVEAALRFGVPGALIASLTTGPLLAGAENLIGNAVKYSPAGKEVHVSAFTGDGRLRINVGDQGPGVAAEDHGVIFEKFGRSNSGQSKPGTGLGLFIARPIVEAHGGRLSVLSHPAGGAVFSLELPV